MKFSHILILLGCCVTEQIKSASQCVHNFSNLLQKALGKFLQYNRKTSYKDEKHFPIQIIAWFDEEECKHAKHVYKQLEKALKNNPHDTSSYQKTVLEIEKIL